MEFIIDKAFTIILAVLSSGLVQFFVTRKDNQKKENIDEKLEPIGQKLDKLLNEQKKNEKDNLRTQLLVMMTVMPHDHHEIMTLAERYFGQLKGDWFYSSLFNKWLKENEIEKPTWFDLKE